MVTWSRCRPQRSAIAHDEVQTSKSVPLPTRSSTVYVPSPGTVIRVPNGMLRSNVAIAPECTRWPSAMVPDRQYIVTSPKRVHDDEERKDAVLVAVPAPRRDAEALVESGRCVGLAERTGARSIERLAACFTALISSWSDHVEAPIVMTGCADECADACSGIAATAVARTNELSRPIDAVAVRI